jgi:proteasome lid subunit RPN8/RPN11
MAPTKHSLIESAAGTSTTPILRFTPYAWAKLLFFRDAGPTEIGGFGITSCDNPSLVEDFVTVHQSVSAVTVAFDDEAVANYFDDQVALSRKPEEFARIWIHTHPGSSPLPSGTDEETFARVFGNCSWAIMFILAKGGATYCRTAFNMGPGGSLVGESQIDFTALFPESDHLAWQEEYDRHVVEAPARDTNPSNGLDLGADRSFHRWESSDGRMTRGRYEDDREAEMPEFDEHFHKHFHEALLEEYMAYWGTDREVF